MAEDGSDKTHGLRFHPQALPVIEKIAANSSKRDEQKLIDALHEISEFPSIGTSFGLNRRRMVRYSAPPFMIFYDLEEGPHPTPLIIWIEVGNTSRHNIKRRFFASVPFVFTISALVAFLVSLATLVRFFDFPTYRTLVCYFSDTLCPPDVSETPEQNSAPLKELVQPGGNSIPVRY